MKRYIALILSLTLILLSFNAYSSNITELKLIVEDSFNGTEGEWVSGWSFSTKPSSGIKHSYAKDPEDSNESVMMLKRDEKLDANGNPEGMESDKNASTDDNGRNMTLTFVFALLALVSASALLVTEKTAKKRA